jgi:hypothetical protein
MTLIVFGLISMVVSGISLACEGRRFQACRRSAQQRAVQTVEATAPVHR